MTRGRRRHKRVRWRSVFLWHRYLGLASALFVAVLAVTGLLLNHTDGLGLDRRPVRAAWLLDWYGIALPGNIIGFEVAGRHATQIGQRLYLERQEIARDAGRLIGAVALENMIIVGTPYELLLMTDSGDLIERLGPAQGTPAGMEALARAGPRVLARTARGVYATDAMLLEWQAHQTAETPQWSERAPIPSALRRDLARRYRGAGLTQERVLLDLHSGRILGPAGVYLIDAAAIAFVLLAALGMWVWASRQR